VVTEVSARTSGVVTESTTVSLEVTSPSTVVAEVAAARTDVTESTTVSSEVTSPSTVVSEVAILTTGEVSLEETSSTSEVSLVTSSTVSVLGET